MNPVSRPPCRSTRSSPQRCGASRGGGCCATGLSLGALTVLTGCDLSGHGPIDRVLWAMLRFNDRVQAALFNPHRLAATFPPSAITRPFRFNAYYPEYQVRTVDAAAWKLELGGLDRGQTAVVAGGTAHDAAAQPDHAADLRRGLERDRAVEWRAAGDFLRRIGADLRARYVGFKCFDDYPCSIDMESALHPQTILALDFDQSPLTPPWGAPLRLRLPTKLGFKNPKYLSALWVTNTYPGGYWADQGYNWFSGL